WGVGGAGGASRDGSGGVGRAMIAEALGVAHATHLDSVQISADGVSGERGVNNGTAQVRAGLPVVVSVTERTPEGRFPNFRGIMRARKKPMQVLGLADIEGVPVQEGGSVVLRATKRP